MARKPKQRMPPDEVTGLPRSGGADGEPEGEEAEGDLAGQVAAALGPTLMGALGVDPEHRSVDFSEEEITDIAPGVPPASDRHDIGQHAEPGRESRGGRLARHGRRVRLYSWAALFFVSFAVLLGITTMVLVRYRPRRAA